MMVQLLESALGVHNGWGEADRRVLAGQPAVPGEASDLILREAGYTIRIITAAGQVRVIEPLAGGGDGTGITATLVEHPNGGLLATRTLPIPPWTATALERLAQAGPGDDQPDPEFIEAIRTAPRTAIKEEDEGLVSAVAAADVIEDGSNQFAPAAEGSPPDALVGNLGEEAFHRSVGATIACWS